MDAPERGLSTKRHLAAQRREVLTIISAWQVDGAPFYEPVMAYVRVPEVGRAGSGRGR